MSLEDFGRELQGKPPKNRDMFERMVMSDEDGCSYDRQVAVVPIHLGVGLAFFGAMLLVAWASGDESWLKIEAMAKAIWAVVAG